LGAGHRPRRRSPDNRTTPARDDRSARIRTRTSEVGARHASGYTTDLESGRPGSNRPLRGGAPLLFRLSYVRICARLESNQRACCIRAELSTELRASKPPTGFEPAPRPYKGRVLPLTLRRPRWRWQESNLRLLGANEVLLPPELHPQGDADGWSRTTTARGTRFTVWGALPCSASA
jgi:hypothetical protein